MEPLQIFPVPFRWIYYLAKAVYKCKKIDHANKQDKKKYFCLLRELIVNRQKAEFVKSSEDTMNDLKKDIINDFEKISEEKFNDVKNNILSELRNLKRLN